MCGLQSLWESITGKLSNPPSADQTYGPPGCLDFVLATPDLAERARSITYDIETRASDHQPILVEFDLG